MLSVIYSSQSYTIAQKQLKTSIRYSGRVWSRWCIVLPFKDNFFPCIVLGEMTHALARLTNELKAIVSLFPGLLDSELANLEKHFLNFVLRCFSLLLDYCFFCVCLVLFCCYCCHCLFVLISSFGMVQFVHMTVIPTQLGNRRWDWLLHGKSQKLKSHIFPSSFHSRFPFPKEREYSKVLLSPTPWSPDCHSSLLLTW